MISSDDSSQQPSHFVQISMRDHVVHGKNSLRYALVVHDGETTHSIPQLPTHISSTAAPTLVSGLQHTADCDMISFTFMVLLRAFLRVRRPG